MGDPNGDIGAGHNPPLSPDTEAITVGRTGDGAALFPPLWQSATFTSATVADSHRAALSPRERQFYSRNSNPTVGAFEDAVADLEGVEAARAFASGMGALSALVLGMCSSGDHIVAQYQLYGGTAMLLESVCPRFGIDVTLVDGTESGAFAGAVQPGRTRLVLAETPANPCLDVVDLDELGAIKGPFTVVDSTFATPLGQRPCDHGVDLVVHSATKGIAGHNDATLGVVAGERDLIEWLWGFAVLHGASASPHDALNGLRGLRTLGVRLERQSSTALHLAQVLEDHPKVVSVRYPGLVSHPHHHVAARQMRKFGGLLSFDVAGGHDDAVRFAESLGLARLATSLGGPETLVTHPVSTTHAHLDAADRQRMGLTDATIRMSVGLEDPGDVVADVVAALG